MLSLHKHFLNLSSEIVHLALRTSILNTLCYIAFLYAPAYNINFIFAASGIFLISIIETLAIQGSTKRRLCFGILVSLSAGSALILGSILSHHPLIMSLGIIFFMCMVGFSSNANILVSTVVMMFAGMFITGSNFPSTLSNSILYGIAFTLGGLLLILISYIHSIFYANTFDLTKRTIEPISPVFSFKQAQIDFAIRLSIAVLISYLLAHTIHLPQAYWVPMTALLVLKVENSFTLQRLNQRFLGTLSGSILAIIALSLIHDKLLLTLLLLPVTFLIITAMAKHYATYALFLTAMVTISFNIVEPLGILVTEERAINTGLGIAIVGVVTLISHLINKRYTEVKQ